MHHPTEFASPDDQAFGTQVLADMLMAFAVKGLAALDDREAGDEGDRRPRNPPPNSSRRRRSPRSSRVDRSATA